LDIQCLSQPPALSDPSVDVNAPVVVVAGATVNLNWTVTNLGPAATIGHTRHRVLLHLGPKVLAVAC